MSQVQTRLFNVHEYERMAEAGILNEDDHVELIRGEIVQMAAIGSKHAACVKRFNAEFSSRLQGRAIASVQDPIRLPSRSEPEPDIALLRPRQDFYRNVHPGADDVLLLVEVADTSLEVDRGVKLALYAEAAIPDVWVTDLEAERIEAYRQPVGGRYTEQEVFGRGTTLAPQSFPDISISVDAIVG